jgi:hypothetical protein
VPKFLKSTWNTQKDEKKQKYKRLIFSALRKIAKKSAKKMQKYLVMSKICSTFALAFAQKTGVTQKA